MFAASLSLMAPLHVADVKLTGVRRDCVRGIAWALLISLLLHVLLILSPAWQLPNLDQLLGSDAPVIQARLVRHAVPHPAPRRAPHRVPAPPPEIADATTLPSSPVDAAPLDDAAKPPLADELQPQPEPQPETQPETQPQPSPELQPSPQPSPETELLPAIIPDVAFALPHRGRIRFSVAQGPDGFVLGKTTHEWHHDNHTYSMTGTTETTGLAALFRPMKIVQSSEGGFAKGALRPREFRDDRGDGTVNTASFDWDKLQVTLNGQQEVSIADGAEDLLSMFYQLTQAAMRGEGFEMAIATGRKVERYAFEWLDEEDITVMAGRFHAWHVRVHAVSGAKDITEVWLGQEVAGLPVKIRQTDRKGGIVDLQAEEIDYEGK